MKSIFSFLKLLFVLVIVLSSCNNNEKLSATKIDAKKVSSELTCDDFLMMYYPDDSIKISLLKNEIETNTKLTGENSNLLKAIIKELEEKRTVSNLALTFEYPLFPIHRLKKNQIGVLGYANSKEVNGQWEDFSKEGQLLKKDFGYQSIDSTGILVSFPKIYDKLYPENKPTVYWYSTRKKGKSSLTDLCYMGDECLSYFQYSLGLKSSDTMENIVFGSPFELDLEYLSKPKLDKKFKEQFIQNCLDCPSNYADQKIFSQLKGSNIYFTQADSWPVNNKLKTPSRSMVLMTKEGKLITIWNSELDLFGCGCF